jgi:hypothetical protein
MLYSHSREPFYFFRAFFSWLNYSKDHFIESLPAGGIPLSSLRPLFLPTASLLLRLAFFCVAYFS